MTYAGDLASLSTLAHELGHAMHYHLAYRSQPFLYARPGFFVGEVASSFHQAMVRAHLLETAASPALRLAVIEEAIGNFQRYLLLMPTLARFELEVHERVERGLALTAGSLGELMAELLDEAYGGEVVLDRQRAGIGWSQFHTHLCRGFYSYQYATGIAAANLLAREVRGGDRLAAGRYLRFLEAGDSLPPLDAVRLAGVDLAAPEPMSAAFATLEGYVDELEQLAGA
jgi:oligoendopeptidase F